MVVSRALRATGCASCRQSLLRSFTSLAILPIRAPVVSSRFPRCQTSTQTRQSSRLASGREGWGDDIEDSKQARIIEEEELDEEFEDLEQDEDPLEERQVSAIPWYLQVDSPRRTPQPLSDRQKIPELPEAPPPILQSLLEQVSVDLGLDDLSLLDLRKLDPPPALGANLIMLIGTARSEKHLHVSADRLCRWLRSTYKLRPDADGLLGRNELKLKLRRKAKRAKLMGSSVDANEDDGVRTGWVCIDVGVVDGVEGGVVAAPKQDFVGFGRRTDGVRIVVQMMTEEKREEIELEKLWSGILRRGAQPEIEGTEENAYALSSETHESLPEPTQRAVTRGPSSILGQTRGFRTSARCLSIESEIHCPSPVFAPGEFVQPPDPNASPTLSMRHRLITFIFEKKHEEAMNILIEFSQRNPPDMTVIREAVSKYIAAQDYDQASNVLLQLSHHIPQLRDGGWKLLMLELLRTYLEGQKSRQARFHVGEHEGEPAPFMKCFNSCLSLYPTQAEAESRIWLFVFAREIGHSSYDKTQLVNLFDELQLAGVKISRPAYMFMLRSLLRPRQQDRVSALSHAAVSNATRILQAMYDQGLDVLDEDMLVELQESVAMSPPEEINQARIVQNPDDTYDLPSVPMSAVERRFHVLSKSIDLPLFSDESRMRLLDLHARNQHWIEFWEVFRMAPRQGHPNSASMYAFMFGSVAQTRNEKACMTVLRNWAPQMEQEQPPVAYEGEVAEAIKACLKIADPYIAETAVESGKTEGEWLRLWRKCSWKNGEDPFIYE